MFTASPKRTKCSRRQFLSRLSRGWCVAVAAQATLRHTSAQVSKEYQLKAVLLWRLAQFTTWPKDIFASDETPIVIGILGDNPFGEALDIAIRGETAHGRKLAIKYFTREQDARSCQILFISRSEAYRIQSITAALRDRSILTVSDIEDFARRGGMIRFITSQNKVTLRINLETVTSAGLVLDARLLRMAEIIKD